MDPSRTHHANQALHLADLINLKFSPDRFGTEMLRYVRVREPDVMSTDGGRKARQAILLCSTEDPDDAGLVCGFVDGVKRHAEIRSYVVVKQAFETRFHKDLDLSRGEYGRFVEKMREFLNTQAIEVRVSNAPRAPSVLAQTHTPPPTLDLPSKVLWWPTVLAGIAGFFLAYALLKIGLLP